MMSDTPPREIVSAAVACGMNAIDWITTHSTDPALLRKMSEDAGLKIVAHTMLKDKFLRRQADYLDDFKASLEDACVLGAPVLMLPPFARFEQISLEDDRKAWTEYFARALPLAQRAGVILTLESTGYVNSPITTCDEVMEVLRAVPGLKLTLDHGNMSTAEDATDAYSRLKEYVVHVHLKDWKIYDSPCKNAVPVRCGKYFADAVIGEGDLDLPGFWSYVDAEARQRLYVNLETMDFTRKGSTVEVLKRVCARLRSW